MTQPDRPDAIDWDELLNPALVDLAVEVYGRMSDQRLLEILAVATAKRVVGKRGKDLGTGEASSPLYMVLKARGLI